jgi:hypothetical protein
MKAILLSFVFIYLGGYRAKLQNAIAERAEPSPGAPRRWVATYFGSGNHGAVATSIRASSGIFAFNSASVLMSFLLR